MWTISHSDCRKQVASFLVPLSIASIKCVVWKISHTDCRKPATMRYLAALPSLLLSTAVGFAPRSTVPSNPRARFADTTSARASSTAPVAADDAANNNNDVPTTADDYAELLSLPARPGRPLKVAISGGGVGGLTAALCMLKKGFDVTVYEKTAAFARFGGPIQFASNALSVLKAIDDTLFERVMDKFTFTGTRTCGIKDGLRADGSFRMTNDSLDYLWNPDAPADWFVKFPLKVRAVETMGENPRKDVCLSLSLTYYNAHSLSLLLSLCSLENPPDNLPSRNAPISSVCPTRESLIDPTCKRFLSMNARKSNQISSSTATP